MSTDFVHLRVKSSYSLAEGAILPKKMVELCKKHRFPAVACTDSNNLFSSLEFSLACSGAGIQPIIGVTISLKHKDLVALGRDHYPTIVLLAKDDDGFANILKLVSYAYVKVEDAAEPHITMELLEEYGAGLIMLSGGVDGPLGHALSAKQKPLAVQLLQEFQGLFGDRLYMEIMRHGLPEQIEQEPIFIELADSLDIPLVATNDVYFASQDMHEAHDVLLCIADGRYVTEEDRRKVTPEHFFKSPRQMKELFADLPDALENTVHIAKRCAVMAKKRPPLLPHFGEEGGDSEADAMKQVAYEGLEQRLELYVYTDEMSDDEKAAKKKEYFERLDYEIGIITQMQFPGYFLIVSDFIRWGKRQDIPIGPGRGSGAGSMVAWALAITDLDPIRYGLLFERFLNPERVSMPDFDIDFCQERREEVIQYVQKRYGFEMVAQIITFGKLQARAVVRDVGRVLQMSYSQVDRISKMIPFNPMDPVTLEKALEMDRELRKMRDDDQEVKKLLDIGMKLEGLNRHASTHAAGVVIGDRPIEQLVPVYRDPRSEMPVSGYSMKYTESAGLVKFDFLGLKTLTVIAKACSFIKETGVTVDVATIPIDDPPTYEMLEQGESVGVFQLESAGMRDTLRKLRPDNIDDIIALISLYRPGPMDNIPSYIARKHGTEEPDYLDPMLEGVLKETYGVIIYQEQVMQIAQIMGGYSLGGADLLRRAMGKKIASEMDNQRKIFVEGAIKNNVDKAKASGIFDLVAKFAGYGFNKSHAAAYSMISYQTAYLKANYPVEFLAASMNLDIHDTDKITTFRQEIRKLELPLLLPNVNHSHAFFVPQSDSDGKRGIRYALGALKNVGTAAMQLLVDERNANGPYEDIFDFVIRQHPQALNKRLFENLIKSGAFDAIHPNRRQLFENMEVLIRYGQSVSEEQASSQNSLFGDTGLSRDMKPQLADVEDWSAFERLNLEFMAIGLYLDKHPISMYESVTKKQGVTFSDRFDHLNDGQCSLTLAGVVISKKMRSSAKGRFATLMLSDPVGMYEVSIFNEDLISSSRELLETGQLLLMRTQARKDEGSLRLTADSVQSVEQISNSMVSRIVLTLNDDAPLDELKEVVDGAIKRNMLMQLIVHQDGHKVTINVPKEFAIDAQSFQLLKAKPWVADAVEV